MNSFFTCNLHWKGLRLFGIDTIICCVLALPVSQTFAQQAVVDFFPIPDQSEYFSVVVSMWPHSEDEISAERIEFPLQYSVSSLRLMSGEWLLEKSDPLVKEETFTRSWFLARKNVADLRRFTDVLDDAAFRNREEMYATGEWPRDWEYQLYEAYSDVRLLGIVRYGYAYLLLVDFKTNGPGNGITTIQTVLINGEYRQSDVTPGLDEATGSLLFSGPISNGIHRELKQRIGIE